MPAARRVLVTGATGYIASQLLPTLRARYDLVLGRPIVEVVQVRIGSPRPHPPR
jgi:uncharacterized protein YbjT (DUF2867 family)